MEREKKVLNKLNEVNKRTGYIKDGETPEEFAQRLSDNVSRVAKELQGKLTAYDHTQLLNLEAKRVRGVLSDDDFEVYMGLIIKQGKT